MTRPNEVPSRVLVLGAIALLALVGCGTEGSASGTDAGPSPVDTSSAGQNDVAAPVDTTPQADASSGNDVGAGADAGATSPDAGRIGDGGTPQELIGMALASIDQKDVQQAVMELYGMSVPNRASGSANYRKATEWAKMWVEMRAPAVQVRFTEQDGLRNTEIVLKGSDPSAGMYIVGGHLDSVAAGPGADDDGSGSIGTMFAAVALAKYQFKSELRFLLFDAEERGHLGSNQYAAALKTTCEPATCFKLYINMDMISNDPRNRSAIRVTTTDMPLRALHTRVNTDFAIGAMLVFGGDACGSSDDCAFQRQGYKTVEIKEDDFSPNWHRPSDTPANQNLATMTKNIKLAAGVAATLAGIQAARP